MIPYVPSPAGDHRLLLWWHRLLQTKELELTFGRSALALSAFLKHMAPPDALLLFTPHGDSVGASLLLKPFMSGASVSLWIDPSLRASRAMLREVEGAYETVLENYPVLLGVTREALLRSHRRWGYTVVGPVPALRDGDAGWIVSLTPEGYYRAKQARESRRKPHYVGLDRAVGA